MSTRFKESFAVSVRVKEMPDAWLPENNIRTGPQSIYLDHTKDLLERIANGENDRLCLPVFVGGQHSIGRDISRLKTIHVKF